MITPQRYREVRLFFESLIDLTPAERDSLLRETRDVDREFASEAEALVAAYDRRGGFIESPVVKLWQTYPAGQACPGTDIGAYRLERLVGEGGMGEVWCAEQRYPVRRRVAVKLIKAGMDTREVVGRFESERQALALMEHPAIAKVFDAGSTPEGRPYVAMEYVAGIPITTYCDQHELTVRERLELFIRVCEGVQHAHQKAVIHRDIKPSNILVTEIDGKPMPKIIDFGVARAMSQRLTDETVFTRAGMIVGTPDYMSPEQSYSAGEDIDTRTDVYALGVVLYELLTGARPLEFRKVSFAEMLRKLRIDDPPRPSGRVRSHENATAIAHSRRTEVTSLIRQLRGDLDAIGLKALEKDRSRRYGAPSELAADIVRYLRNEPVAARPAGLSYRARKYTRRHRAGAGAVAVLTVLLVSFAISQAVQLRRITRERDRADRITSFMTSMFQVPNPSESRGNQITARELLDKASHSIETGLADDPETQAQMMDVMGTVYYDLGLYPKAAQLLDQALRIRARVLGAGAPKTALSMDKPANALYDGGHRVEAEKLYREALTAIQLIDGPEHPDTLKVMDDVANMLADGGRYEEAENLQRKIFEIRLRLFGPEHPDTLTTMDGLGDTLERRGHFQEAETLAREALKVKRRVLGSDHPDTVWAMQHLTNVLEAQGRLTEAEQVANDALAIRERVLGPEHPNTLDSMLTLANTLQDEGRNRRAENLVRNVVDIRRRVLPPGHPTTLLAMNNLAEILGDEGQYAEAEKVHREVLATRTRVMGPEHSHTLYSMSRLAWILILRGRLDEAGTLSRQAHDLQLKVLGLDHPDTADSAYNLSCIAAQRGSRDEALAYLKNAIEHGLKPSVLVKIENDPSLRPLHRDPRFIELLDRIRGAGHLR